MTRLTEHFSLEELIAGSKERVEDVPAEVRANLLVLCETLLEPVRAHFGRPIAIHSGWRPLHRNLRTPGASPTSDHVFGRAADFHVVPEQGAWQAWIKPTLLFVQASLAGKFGQLIHEDHRKHNGRPGSVWVHVAITTPKHPGTEDDRNRLLFSPEPGLYLPLALSEAA